MLTTIFTNRSIYKMLSIKKLAAISLFIVLVIPACKKKIDYAYDNRPGQAAGVTLNTRLVNLIGYRELQIGEKRLTSFLPPDREGYYGSPGTMRVTPYFPQTGQLTTVYSLPGEFLSSDGYIHDILLTTLSGRDAVGAIGENDRFSIRDYGRTPMDYYRVRYEASFSDSMFAVPRDITASSNPANFKIRILNLSTNPDYYQRQGKMTLAFSDGRPVSSKTSAIDRGKYSDYIELPYGTYQFKVLAEDEREVPHKAVSFTENAGSSINILNPNTGTLMAIGEGDPGPAGFNDSWLNYAPVRTFQPGGVYTIVVSNITGWSEAMPGSNGETIGVIVNCFQVIADISEPLNHQYARVQAVNTLPGSSVKWQVNGNDLGTTGYTETTAYLPFLTGKHAIKAVDGQGAVLAEQEVSLLPGDNITAWVYRQGDGTAITLSNNNLSGIYGTPVNGNDGSASTRRDAYPYWLRFMNFCTDVQDVTFTANNGQPLGAGTQAASQNILYGVQKTIDPYIRQGYNFSTSILAYASKPGVIPGNWIHTIQPLPASTFIKNIGLYKTEGKPNSEPGIYTVALVGQLNQEAKLILIKHNQ